MSDEATSTVTESSELSESEESSNNPDSWDYAEPEQVDKEEEAESKAPKAESKAPKAEAKPERERRTVKVDGKDELVDVEEAIKAYSKNKSADQQLREVAEQKKNMARFIEALQNDPEKVLNGKNIPITKEARRKLAEKWLYEEIESEMKDPRDVALAERDAKLKEYQDREQEEEQEYQNEVKAEQVQQRKAVLSKVFEEAMKESPLSQDPVHAVEAMRDMAMYYRIARQNGENPTPQEVAAHVENATLSRFHKVAQTLSGDQLVKLLGSTVLNQIRKADLAALRAKHGGDSPKLENNDTWNKPSNNDSKSKFMSPQDAKEAVRKKLGL